MCTFGPIFYAAVCALGYREDADTLFVLWLPALLFGEEGGVATLRQFLHRSVACFRGRGGGGERGGEGVDFSCDKEGYRTRYVGWLEKVDWTAFAVALFVLSRCVSEPPCTGLCNPCGDGTSVDLKSEPRNVVRE